MASRTAHAELLLLLLLPLLATPGATAEPSIPEGHDFGAGLTLSEPTPLAALLARPEAFSKRTVLVRGRVADVCQKKGCWTVLRDGEASVRVRFRDYAFFLPRDAQGREAWVEGVATVRTLSKDEARHYAAESSGGDPSAIEGPQREVGFLASGVRLLPAP